MVLDRSKISEMRLSSGYVDIQESTAVSAHAGVSQDIY
jgi:hypothetical protein